MTHILHRRSVDGMAYSRSWTDEHSLFFTNDQQIIRYIYVIMCANLISTLYSPNFPAQSILRVQGQNRAPIPISYKVFRLVGLRSSEMATSTTSSGSSVSAFLWSLVINGLIFLAFFVGFLLVCTTRLFHVEKY